MSVVVQDWPGLGIVMAAHIEQVQNVLRGRNPGTVGTQWKFIWAAAGMARAVCVQTCTWKCFLVGSWGQLRCRRPFRLRGLCEDANVGRQLLCLSMDS